jgi:hypothetical protein
MRNGWIGLAVVAGVMMASAAREPAHAQRYQVACVATPWCKIYCSSNTRRVTCRAFIRANGTCFKRCWKG